MRRIGREEGELVSHVPLEDRVPANQALNVIRMFVCPIVAELSPRFESTRHSGVAQRQRKRKLVEETFGGIRQSASCASSGTAAHDWCAGWSR